MIVLSVNGLTKSFLSENILENVTFSISDRDKVGIVGDNGSGKTTLANNIKEYINSNSKEFNDYHAVTISFPFHSSEMYHTIRESLLPGKKFQQIFYRL